MPKISSLNVKSVIIKFIAKSLALTTTSIILISSVASFIIYKLDLDLSYCKYAGYLISALTSFIVPFICLKPFKNNILFLSFLSIIPLVLFTLANFIFFGKEFVQLFISLAIIIAVAFVTGVMSAGKRRWLKLSDIPIELKKEFNLEDENEKKTDIEKIIVDNKTVIYSIVFYACSLAIGTVLYRLLQSSALDSVLKPSNANFSKLFSQNICNYLSLFFNYRFSCFLPYRIRFNKHYSVRYRHSGWNEGSIFLHKLSSKGCRLYNSYDCAFCCAFSNRFDFCYPNKQQYVKANSWYNKK